MQTYVWQGPLKKIGESEICFWCLFCCISGKLKRLCILLWLFQQPEFWNNWPEFLQLFLFLLFAYCVPHNWFSFLCKTAVFYVVKFICNRLVSNTLEDYTHYLTEESFTLLSIVGMCLQRQYLERLCFGVKWCFTPCNRQPYQFHHGLRF